VREGDGKLRERERERMGSRESSKKIIKRCRDKEVGEREGAIKRRIE